MKFWEIDDIELEEASIILDIDGTIMPAGKYSLDSMAEEKISSLKDRHDIYLLSNRNIPGRAGTLARKMGIKSIETNHRKPDIRVLRGIDYKKKGLVVIGDKILTDGLLSFFVGAKFIKVDRLVAPDESLGDRILNFVDDTTYLFWLFIKLARPEQWVKNILIFVPLFFAKIFFQTGALINSFIAFVSFSLVASAGYVVNDIVDQNADSYHPKKKSRPLAKNDISVIVASVYASVIIFIAFALLNLGELSDSVKSSIALYLILSISYSVFFKKIPILEMILFIGFYLMRIMVGGFAVDVNISSWLILSTAFLSLFLVIAKRYAESRAFRVRTVLLSYSPKFLESMLSISASLVLISYGLYSILDNTSEYTVYSTLFVLFGVMRYLQIALNGDIAEYPEKIIFKDRIIQVLVIGWFIFMFFIYY